VLAAGVTAKTFWVFEILLLLSLRYWCSSGKQLQQPIIQQTSNQQFKPFGCTSSTCQRVHGRARVALQDQLGLSRRNTLAKVNLN
jgi:hypothetical protein